MSCVVIMMSHNLSTTSSQVKIAGSSVLSESQREFPCLTFQETHWSWTLHSSANRPTLICKDLPSMKTSRMSLLAKEAFRMLLRIHSTCVASFVPGVSMTRANLNRLSSSSRGVWHKSSCYSIYHSSFEIGTGFIRRLSSMILKSYCN